MLAAIEGKFHDLYLAYFHKAEAHRRWNLLNDIPWEKTGTNPDPDVVQVVQAFMAVEMFLPDYTSKLLHLVRSSRGRAWFQANWGYEESKHSLALEMWLTNSGARTEAQIREFQHDDLVTIVGTEQHLVADLAGTDVLSLRDDGRPDETFGHRCGRRNQDSSRRPALAVIGGADQNSVVQHLDRQLVVEPGHRRAG